MKVLSFRDQLAAGKALRKKVPRISHGRWRPQRKDRDIVAMFAASNRGRIPHLVPIRYARMLHSPLAFLRGAAEVMTFDLAGTPTCGIRVQACGDAHLLNFGGFATPERHLIFDVDDFDETLPAPWEWDVKRLAASVEVAARGLKLGKSERIDATRGTVGAYREAMARYAPMGALERWYERIDAAEVIELGKSQRIREDPPLRYRPRKGDLTIDHVRTFLKQYRATLRDDRKLLLDRFALADVAVKVLGVGSVGRRTAVALLMASEKDTLFLQLKEARASVLEPYAGRSRYRNHGERVVQGQRVTQAASDIFLGWSRIQALGADFYVRQLRDCKTVARIEGMNAGHLLRYARHCGHALARAHAKAGNATAISGYLGRRDMFDEAVASFAQSYADQTLADFETLRAAAKAGKIPVEGRTR